MRRVFIPFAHWVKRKTNRLGFTKSNWLRELERKSGDALNLTSLPEIKGVHEILTKLDIS